MSVGVHVTLGAHADALEGLGHAPGKAYRDVGADAFFLQIGIIVDADERAPAGRGLRFRGPLREVAMAASMKARPREAALRLHLLEQLPGFPRQGVGEPLDVIATRRGIGHLIEMGFVFEEKLQIGGEPVGEFERLDDERVAAAENRGKRLGGDPQQIGVGLVEALVGDRGPDVQLHGGGRSEGVRRLRPKEARGAQLGDFEEVVGTDGEDETDVPVAPRQAIHTGGKGEGQFLNGGSAEVMEVVGADGERRFGARVRQCAEWLPVRWAGDRDGERIFAAKVRLDRNVFRRPPDQFLLIVGSGKVGVDRGFPLAGSDGRKLL